MKRKTFISCIAPSAPETAGRRLKRAAMTLLAALLTAMTAGAQDAITGLTYNSTGGYYEISNAQDLVDLATYVNGGNNASGKTFKQTQDIDMSSAGNFEPIGRQPNNYKPTPFNGTYDGQGYAIIGLTVNTESQIAGLFGYMKGGSVRNLTMVNPHVTSKDNSESSKYAGGIVGAISPGTIENCNVINPTLEISSENGQNIKGAICGGITDEYCAITDCYYYTTTNYNAVGLNSLGVAYSASRTYTLTLNDGITTSTAPAFSYGGTEYYAGTITLAAAPMGWVYEYSVNGSPIDGNTFDISGNATVSRTAAHISPLLGYDDDTLVDGSAEHPYTIKTTEGWDLFCDMLADNDQGFFSGKTVRLGANITVSRMAGSTGHEFAGTFDGGGYTLTVSITGTVQGTAPFCEIKGATIRNLVVTGSVAGKRHSAGLVGFARGDDASVENTIENCLVATDVSIKDDDKGYLGGIVGHGLKCKLTIRGCAFTGSLTSESYYTSGLQGWSDGNTLILENDIFAASSVSAANNGFHPIAIHNNASTTATVSNVYYTIAPTCTTSTLIAAAGKQAHTVAAGENVTLALSGTATEYGVSGITVYEGNHGIKFGTTYYAGVDDQLSLTLSNSAAPQGYCYDTYVASAGTLSGTTLTMPDQDVTITAAKTPDPAHFSVNDAGTEYTILTATGWNVFCDLLADNTMGYFSGKTVQLGTDITVTRMAGGSNHAFTGTFDGGGHTLTLDYGTADAPIDAQFVAPFVETANDGEHQPTFRNLTIAGTIYDGYTGSADHNVGGLIGHLFGTVTIEHCTSLVEIHAKVGAGGFVGLCEHSVSFNDCHSAAVIRSADGSNSGFVAWSRDSKWNINFTGCLFDGKLLQQNGSGSLNGGFIGWTGASKTVTITNSLCAPAPLADDETMASSGSATFARGWNATTTATNCYDTAAFENAQGKATRTVTAAADVTIGAIALTGTPTQYTVSGITAYSGGGLQLGQTLYYGSGDQLSLTLSKSATGAPRGYRYDGYTASAGTLSGTTLTMPDQDVTITAALAPIDWATGNQQGDSKYPYMIYNKDQLLLLAHRVNGTNGETANTYEGKYFKLGADITFDPNVLTLDEGQSNYEAIGGYIGGYTRNFNGKFDGDGHTVSGIRICKDGDDDADFYQALFGQIGSRANIHDVHLTDASIKGYDYVGGIVGFNPDHSIVSGCTVTNSHITATGEFYGTICGFNADGTLRNNYYHGCTVNSTAVTSGKGCEGADIADDNGALPAYAITLGDGVSTTVLASTPENGFVYNGVSYYREGLTLPLASTLASEVPAGYTLFSANGTAFSGSDYTVSATDGDVTITTAISIDPAQFSVNGAGTEYTIYTAGGWNVFCDLLVDNDKGYFSGKTVRLGADITATTTVGKSDHPFTGTFDGNDKTLTVNINETSTQGTAPFRYISGGAVIRNLTVVGTVTGTGTTHAAGLVGFSEGGTSESPNTIEDCTVSTSVSGGSHNGGVVGHGLTSYLKIKNTVFSGSIANGSSYMGGLQGWSDGNHLTIDNCIFKGSYSGSGSFHPIAIHNPGSTTTANVSRAYYTVAPTLTDAAKIAATGTQVSTSAPSDVVYGSVTAADNQTYYAPVTVSGINKYYFYTGNEIAIDYTVTAADGTSLTKDTHYTGTISPATVKDIGDYTLTLTGTGNYSGSQTFHFTVPSYINLPINGTKTLNLTEGIESFKVYDDGGKDGNYSNNCSGSLTINAPTGYVLKLSGSITAEIVYDKLTVYDNSEASGPKLLDGVSSSSNGTQTDITTVTSTGSVMTLYFNSDKSYNLAGLDLTVTVVNASTDFDITTSTVTGGSITADKSKAKVNDVVTLTATPENGYLLSGLSVKDADNNDVVVTDMPWYTGINTATFAMPASNVTVTPTFTNTLTVEGGLYINMPATGTKSATIPSGVQSFKVYDDGGKDWDYSNDCSGTLVLTAPEGYVLQLSGSITAGSVDKLTVYDNSEASGTQLLSNVSSTPSGTATAIIPVVSTGQSMTLYFYSDKSGIYPGLDLMVTVVNASTDFDITTSTVTGGSITADKSKAKVNDVITLTATPENGYMLSGLSVKDADNKDVVVTDMLWYTGINTATFAMPASNVTVTPTFTNDLTSLYINMPKTGTMAAIIPSGVKSFKVYDDGGASGNYSNNCSGTLTLTAPAGYVLQLSGSIRIEENFDFLTVYNNSEASGTKLLDGVRSSSDGAQTDITTVTSTGQSMTLYFYSDESRNYAGLDLTVMVVKPIELADAADNTEAINGWQNGLANVTLQGRTLYKDGSWNTLCLPFDVTIAGSPLSGNNVQAMTLNTTTSNLTDGTLTLNFEDATGQTIPAGKPFIIKWDNTGVNIESPVFEGVTIDAEKRNATIEGVLTFTGTYAPVSIADGGDNAKLYLGADNKLYYPNASMTIGCHRAYFQLAKGITAGNPTGLVRAFNLNFGDDEATGIVSAEANSSLFTLHSSLSEWYTLDGRRLDGQPTAKGLYIHQGKKVAIK